MSKTIHYVDGCAWADGQLYSFDTRQIKDWRKVTCRHCLKRNPTKRKRLLGVCPACGFIKRHHAIGCSRAVPKKRK